MQNNQPVNPNQQKKSAKLAMKMLVVAIILFLIIMARFALTLDTGSSASNRLPDQSDAYSMAKRYIEMESKGSSVSFSDDGYGFQKKSDSVYVIRAAANISSPDGEKQVSYTTMLKYTGGIPDNERSWKLIDISRNQ